MFANPNQFANGNHLVEGAYFETNADTTVGIWIENHTCVTVLNARGAPREDEVLVRITGSDDPDQFGATHVSLFQLQTGAAGIAVDDQARSVSVPGPLVSFYHTDP